MGDPESDVAFIGRSDELRLISDALDEARTGTSRTVIVGGEAGVGKTTLIRRVLELHQDEPGTVLSGGCLDLGDSPWSFGAVLAALRPLDPILNEDMRRTLLDPVRAHLAAFTPAPLTVGTADGGSRAQLFELVLALIEGLGDLAPVTLVLEDLHWSDRSTRDLLTFLIPNLEKAPVSFVLSYRSDELAPGHQLLRYLAEIQRHPGVVRLQLGCLDRPELVTLLETVRPTALGDRTIETIWERSGGNPFYAEELAALAAKGDVTSIPDSLSDMLLGRIRSLASTTQRVLRLAAAGGIVVDSQLLAEVATELTSAELDEALRQAVEGNVLVTAAGGEELRFRHALLREVAYRDMLPRERREGHARFGRLLALMLEQGSRPEALESELARHLFHAGEFVSALAASLEAASVAEAAHGYAECRVHLERAIAVWPEVDGRDRPEGLQLVDLQERAASAAHLEGMVQRAVELGKAALASAAEGSERGRVLTVRLGEYLAAAGMGADALGVLEQAVAEIGDESSSVGAEALGAYARSLMAAARHRESLEQARRALTMSRAVGHRAQESHALTTIGSNLVLLDQPDVGVADLYRALELAEELKSPNEIISGYRNLAATLSGPLNRLDEALGVALRGVSRVVDLGLERHWGVSLRSVAADTLFRLGRWDEAEDLIDEAMRRSPGGASVLDLLLARAKLAVGRGEFKEASADLASVRSRSIRAIDFRYKVPVETLAAGLALWEGRIDDARAAVSAGLAWAGETDDVWFVAPLVWHGARAEADGAARARARFHRADLEVAEAGAHDMRQRSRELLAVGRPPGALQHLTEAYDHLCAGELGRARGTPQEEPWAGATEVWDDLGHCYPAAYSRFRWAEALLSRPHGSTPATPLLRHAHRTADRLGASPLRALIERVAHGAGIEMTAVDASDDSAAQAVTSVAEELVRAAGLTRREVQVLELVAQGASNRRIATVLFISEKTASVHVSNLMAKLGVGSRVQAAALLIDARHAPSAQPSTD